MLRARCFTLQKYQAICDFKTHIIEGKWEDLYILRNARISPLNHINGRLDSCPQQGMAPDA